MYYRTLRRSPAGAWGARLRGPDISGRPSEPELDNASEGREYLLISLANTCLRGNTLPARAIEQTPVTLLNRVSVKYSYRFDNLGFIQSHAHICL